MIISNSEMDARLDAIKLLTDYNTKSVKIFYVKDKKEWCCDWEVFTMEEMEEMED